MMQQDRVIGGLVLLSSQLPHSPMRLLLSQPVTWFHALRRLGLRSLVDQLWDLLQVRRRAQALVHYDYITALYVDEAERQRGYARQLLTHVITHSRARGTGLAVDTNLSNVAAKSLYASLGFAEHGRTKRSIILTLDAD